MSGKIIMILALIVFAASDCLALTDAEYKRMYNNSTYFRDADNELSTTWKKVNRGLSAKDKKWLLEDQRNWLKSERDEQARELMERGLTKECAYARVAKRRTGNLEVFLYNANLSKAEQDAGMARADDYYYNEDDDEMPASCRKK